MAKRKTKKKKLNRDYEALKFIYQGPASGRSSVKREFRKSSRALSYEPEGNDLTVPKAQTLELDYNKRDIVKSLILASLILSLELVLYFVWK